ncbi:MAG: GGDEF domain-containing protein [Acidobacteriota bacterium]
MSENVRRSTDRIELPPVGKQSWQIWMLLVLAGGLLGMGISLYGLFRQPSFSWDAHALLSMLPPLMFGILALFLLASFYIAQKEAVLAALRQELLTQKIEAELNRELALLDPITEVYNRRYARIILTREASRVKRYGSTLALMMVDITGFRRVNDSIGHTGGDVVLRQIAHLIQSKIRNSDIVIRFGGDEFLLILPEAEAAGIERLIVRLKHSIIEWAPRAGMGDFKLRFAIGLACFNPEGRVDETLSLAEERMLQDRGSPDPEPHVVAAAVAAK